jgi:hypothetical protein
MPTPGHPAGSHFSEGFASSGLVLLPSAVHLFRTLTLSPTSRFCSCPPGTMGGSRKMKYTVAKTRRRRSSGGTTEKSVPRDLRAAGQQGSTLESRCMGGRRRDSRRLRTSSARPVRDQHWSSRFRPGPSYGVYAMAELAESVRPKRANHAVPESNLAGQKLPHLEGHRHSLRLACHRHHGARGQTPPVEDGTASPEVAETAPRIPVETP